MNEIQLLQKMTNANDVPQAFSPVRCFCGMSSGINVLGNLFLSYENT